MLFFGEAEALTVSRDADKNLGLNGELSVAHFEIYDG